MHLREYALDEFVLSIAVGSTLVEVLLNRKAYMSHSGSERGKKPTAKRIFVIHCLLSAGYFVMSVESSSVRLGMADRGATPANPNSTARMIGIPCVWPNAALAGARSSFVDVRLIRECYKNINSFSKHIMSKDGTVPGRDKQK